MTLLKNIPFLFIACLFIGLISCSDDDPIVEEEEMESPCGTEIYGVNVFTEVSVSTHVYGNGLSVLGNPTELSLDVYQPVGDTSTSRPVIAWAFGGSFIGGDRTQMASFATTYAEKGFVCVAMDYRLLNVLINGIPDSLEALDIAVKASHDIKAAVRYMRQDAATENLFKIDPDKIFLGGLSSGGIASVQAAMFTQEDLDDASPFVANIINSNGGLEGLSGDAENLTYSSAVSGVISLSGGVYSLDFIDAGDPPIISYHGNNDAIVPYGFGFANVLGINLVSINGSGVIHPHCESIGLDNELYTIVGGDHNMIYTDALYANDRAAFETNTAMFLSNIICE